MKPNPVCISFSALMFCIAPSTQAAVTLFSQGFEVDTIGWTPFGGSFDASRVPSSTGGITSSEGSFHGTGTTPATNWGGYNYGAGSVPTTFQAYSTSIDIYLGYAGSDDVRLDWSSAVSNSSGGFLRDFVFNLGYYDDIDNLTPGNQNGFIVSASNNAGRTSSVPNNPGRDPFAFDGEGWYTFEHVFSEVAGDLSVTMNLIDASDSLLHTWTLTNSDDITGVGGNRYGWVANNEFASLAIDSSSLTVNAAPIPETGSFLAGIVCLGGFFVRRRKA